VSGAISVPPVEPEEELPELLDPEEDPLKLVPPPEPPEELGD
jgi:hypothetical protein